MTFPNESRGPAPAGPTLIEASRLVALSINVLPIRAGTKQPAVKTWKVLQDRCLFDMNWDLVDQWLCKHWDGSENGLAVVAGAVSGLVIVDVDDEAARQFVEKTCGWPRTPTVRTSKGWHLWFAHPGGQLGNRTRIDGVGLDVRADGGYAVVPPSVHPSGLVYRWEVSPFEFAGGMWPPAELPPTLAEALWTKPPPAPKRRFPRVRESGKGSRYVSAAAEREALSVATAPEGGRNDTLNRAAYSLGRFVSAGELEQAEAERLLIAAAGEAGLPAGEARATVSSGLRARR